MSNIILDDVLGGYALNKINANFDKIESVINYELLHSSGGSNVMSQPLDMNSYKILNLPTPINPTDPVRLVDVPYVQDGVDITVPTIQEEVVLSDGQLTAAFTGTTTTGAEFYIAGDLVDNGRLSSNDIESLTETTITLKSSYPQGTILTLVKNSGKGNQVESDETIRTFDTVGEATSSATLVEGNVLLIKERVNSLWDVVDATTVTPNGFDIIASTANTGLAFTLRVISYSGAMTTVERNGLVTLTSNDIGANIYDSTLGKPIWLSATTPTWVDATGAVV